ncbi:Dynamitin-domain-containing protein [Pyronema domesticum]|uniref:Similar to Dynactin subunit 2-A acc. no. Q66J30 n=1 Tax=Pyronema omphalodes (strain CBS 100304) TaxID=1076935 RepID=U4LE63_PYROM|nr:Dynamitin-domain-containing protein [Pyronema domesticum]CCX30163.1 Similar to Dynactin subunit 2-A; acc. no. Q66J30 [Pyronema omphalodes CBS 100304]
MTSKYAALPDLDSSQDVYETPDLASDITTLPDDDHPLSHDIDSSHLVPSAAADRFRNSRVDATHADFSDRLTAKRASYAVSSEVESSSETTSARLARLQREIEELRADIALGEGEDEETKEGERRGVEELATALEGLNRGDGAQERLARKMVASLGAVGRVKKTADETGEATEATGEATAQPTEADKIVEKGRSAEYTVTYAPAYKASHTLGRVADFDHRLALLEKALGLSASTLDATPLSPAMLPQLDELSRQLAVLSQSTTSSLDSASRRVKQLTQDTEKLAEARKAAKAAVADDPMENEEMLGKINALYGVLPAIEGMRPLLPAMLERLRSLRAIHADAGRASETIRQMEERIEENEAEIQKWTEALVNMEGVVKENRGQVEENVKMVEGWVKEIEEKMKRLG